MVTGEPLNVGPDAADEAKAYLRVVGADEDALVARLVATSAGLCEAFTKQALFRRSFQEVIAPMSSWKRLSANPVTSISSVRNLPLEGEPVALGSSDYAVDIDAAGQGWVRVASPIGVKRVGVSYRAGLAEDWSGLPEPLRQGIIRLVGHLYMHRYDESDSGVPAAVTALWRPWRKLSLGGVA